MNVGFSLLTLFPGRVGGSESNVRGLLEQFAAGNGPSAVTVLANRHVMRAYADMDHGPVSLHEVRSYRPGNSTPTRALAMTSARALPARAARDVPEGIDLIHYPVTVPIPSTRAPCVTTVYDLQHHDMPQFFSPVERAYRRWAYDSAARAADMVLTTSAWSKGRLVDLLGLSPERVEVVHMGVDGERFSPQPGDVDQDSRARLGLPERYLIYPANLWPHKNHERLAAHARRLGVEDRVRHLGYVDRAMVPAIYRQAVAMIFPSLYEGFGSPPVEAMACGCPVAASPRGSLAEVCGGAALEIEPESVESISAAIDRLSADADLLSRLASAGLERARAFSWRRSAEQHTAIYGHVCATFGAPAR